MQTIVGCYLWDLLDEGVEAVVDRLAGEIGATGVCVPATYHSIDQIRPHEAAHARRYHHEAAAYFQPDRQRYASTRIRASVAGWLGRRNPLSGVCEASRAAGLAVHLWVVACHGSTLVSRYGWAVGKDVFGASLDMGLCPSNPEVRQYVCELVGDVSSNYGAESIVLDSAFYPPRHAHAHAHSGLEPGCVETFLSGLCFCESCRQRAIDSGLDVEPVVRSVRVALERWHSSGRCEPKDLDSYLGRDTLLVEYVAMRCRLIAEWVHRLRSSCSCRLVYHLPSCATVAGVDVSLLADQVDTCLVTIDGSNVQAVIDHLRQLSAAAGGAGSPAVRVHAYPPRCPDAPSLVRTLAGLADRGVRQVYLENYGLIPTGRLSWLRQAIRAASRAAS
ncbi:MAG TPA: hypothetical protein VMZ31_11040 [Phycisphaerae bacterium]|nr:hypothetical protein [Phycisphaerae bacterium]